MMMTKEEAKKFKEGWALVNETILEEIRALTPVQRYQDFISLFQLAYFMGWNEQLSAEDQIVRERWQRLKEASNERIRHHSNERSLAVA